MKSSAVSTIFFIRGTFSELVPPIFLAMIILALWWSTKSNQEGSLSALLRPINFLFMAATISLPDFFGGRVVSPAIYLLVLLASLDLVGFIIRRLEWPKNPLLPRVLAEIGVDPDSGAMVGRAEG